MPGIADLRAAIGSAPHPARAVPCPRCHAAPWTACSTPSGRRLTQGPHPARITAWEQQETQP